MNTILKVTVVLNAWLFLALLILWIIPSVRMYTDNESKASAINMKPFMRRDPFTILVDSEFPGNQSFCVGSANLPIFFSFKQEEEKFLAKVCVGTDTDVSISFTGKHSPKIDSVSMFHNGTFFYDYNLDGLYDEKLEFPNINKEVNQDTIEVETKSDQSESDLK